MNARSLFLTTLVAVFSFAVSASATSPVLPPPAKSCVEVKPALKKAGDNLLEKLEIFDEALHALKVEGKLIEITHHFEEGLLDLIGDLESGGLCKEIFADFQHFHEDVQLLYAELKANPQVFYTDSVLGAWNTLLPAFVHFQNVLYYY